MRADGAHVILGEDARLLGWLGRSERSLLTFLEGEPHQRAREADALAQALAQAVDKRLRGGFLIAQVDGEPVASSALASALLGAGFQATSRGFLKRSPRPAREEQPQDLEAELADD
jgi:ATP-dependent Lhr-like helicase